MILSGNEILKRREKGEIKIEPFNIDRVGVNSYDLTLSNVMATYEIVKPYRDIKDNNFLKEFVIQSSGTYLNPGKLYLGKTAEYTETYNLVPMIEGVSSVARHGIFVHVTAGFGDIGFCGNWTLEISVVEPVRIYAGMRIAQIYYHTVEGAITRTYGHGGKYQGSKDIVGSRLYREFE